MNSYQRSHIFSYEIDITSKIGNKEEAIENFSSLMREICDLKTVIPNVVFIEECLITFNGKNSTTERTLLFSKEALLNISTSQLVLLVLQRIGVFDIYKDDDLILLSKLY